MFHVAKCWFLPCSASTVAENRRNFPEDVVMWSPLLVFGSLICQATLHLYQDIHHIHRCKEIQKNQVQSRPSLKLWLMTVLSVLRGATIPPAYRQELWLKWDGSYEPEKRRGFPVNSGWRGKYRETLRNFGQSSRCVKPESASSDANWNMFNVSREKL